MTHPSGSRPKELCEMKRITPKSRRIYIKTARSVGFIWDFYGKSAQFLLFTKEFYIVTFTYW